MIEPSNDNLSIKAQCRLLSIGRSGLYYDPKGESPLNLQLMRLIDEQFLITPFYGSRQMARHLRREGYCVGRHRVRRLMRLMGIEAIYQKRWSCLFGQVFGKIKLLFCVKYYDACL